MLNRGEVRATLAAVAGVALVVLLLLKLGGMLDAGWGGAWDRAVLLGARGLVPDAPLVALTALGSGRVLVLVVAVAAGAMLVARAPLHAALLVATSATGGLAVDALKHVVARARPSLVEHLVTVGSPSFPSAHSANSALTYLMLAALFGRLAPRFGRAALAAAIVLVAAIGTSRVMLGVHWPSDVLAGWLFGAAWALGWWVAARRWLVGKSGALA